MVDVDARRVGRLGMLAAGAQAQSKPRLVEYNGGEHEDCDSNVGGNAGVLEQQRSDKRYSAKYGNRGDPEGIGKLYLLYALNDAGHEDGKRGGEHV